jgi:hypothetical protein
MDERHARFSAGPEGDRSTHRVGLTRHCLASGLVQLPFALRNALPEGALLAHDVERDAALDLTFVPPRQLAGLTGFFAEHELQVNDEIELRLAAGEPPELRLVPVRRPRAAERQAPSQDAPDAADAARPRPARTASVWRSWREDGPSPTRPAPEPSAGEAAPRSSHEGPDPDVVERFGSVTVRRLGTGRFGETPTSVLTDAAAEGASSSSSHAAADAEHARTPLEERPERLLGIDPDGPRDVRAQDDLLALDDGEAGDDVDEIDEAWLLHGPDVASEVTAADPDAEASDGGHGVRQASLFDLAAAEPAAARPAKEAPPPRPVAEPASAPSATPIDDVPPIAADLAAAQREREEALSRAGDLRSRIVRWMLSPGTPVIVSTEAVQEAFDLPVDVARDIVEGILESPPPSLRLTRLRADLLRVSRITVEQDA